MPNANKPQIKAQTIEALARAICLGEPYTTEEDARESAQTMWERNLAVYGFWPAVGQCEIAAARYADM